MHMVDNFKLIKELFKENKIDTALVSIFTFVDDIRDHVGITELFETFKNEKFNEDIYISLLASTLYFKNNEARKKYYGFVKNELLKDNDNNQVEIILSGL